MHKYSKVTNWYVQRTAGAILVPAHDAMNMLQRVAKLKADGVAQAECGLMAQTLIAATGAVTHIELWPLTVDGTIKSLRTAEHAPFVAELKRAVALIVNRHAPITKGAK